jgi:beta-lactamase superfamily II metal-dependent hydrolase
MDIYFFNVKQGDSILIKYDNDKYGIIDCNYFNISDDPPVLKAIKNLNVNHFLFICVTHPHADHYQGFSSLIDYIQKKNIPVDYFVDFGMSEIPELFDFKAKVSEKEYYKKNFVDLLSLYELYNKRVKSKRQPITYRPTVGFDSFLFENDNWITRCYSPLHEDTEIYRKLLISQMATNTYIDNMIDHNILSSLIRTVKNSSRILFGSDLPKNHWKRTIVLAQNAKINFKSNLLKISHHGSKNSYIEGLFESIFDETSSNENICILSCGHAIKGLPHEDVIQELINNKIYPFCTNRSVTCSVKKNCLVLDSFPTYVQNLLKNDMFVEPEPCFGNILLKVTDKHIESIITENSVKCDLAHQHGLILNTKIIKDKEFWDKLLS